MGALNSINPRVLLIRNGSEKWTSPSLGPGKSIFYIAVP